MMTTTGMIIMVVAATGTGKSESEPVVAACDGRLRDSARLVQRLASTAC
jgi:hypothetical protein